MPAPRGAAPVPPPAADVPADFRGYRCSDYKRAASFTGAPEQRIGEDLETEDWRPCRSSNFEPVMNAAIATGQISRHGTFSSSGASRSRSFRTSTSSARPGETIMASNYSSTSMDRTKSTRGSGGFKPSGRWAHQRLLVYNCLFSRNFDLSIGLVIIVNSICIGFEQSFRLQQRDVSTFVTLENVFITLYIGELFMRFFAQGVGCLTEHWVKFDLVLVVTSVMIQWILEPLLGNNEMDNFEVVMMVKMARLARLARALRLVVKFHELWVLVRGLLVSMNMMFYTFLLLFIVLYFFAAVGVELITLKHDGQDYPTPEFEGIVEKHFQTLPGTMLTLVQFVCMDSIGNIYRPLIEQDYTLAFYFMGVILVVAIVMMNIITAVLVNGALEQASLDKEAQRAHEHNRKKRLMSSLREVFERLDEDGSGQVDIDEIANASDEDRVLLNEFMKMQNPIDIFNMLDVEGVGSLGIDEFCEGLYQAAISNTPIELKRMDKRMDTVRYQLNSLESNQAVIRKTLLVIREELRMLVKPLDQNNLRCSRSTRSYEASTPDPLEAVARELEGLQANPYGTKRLAVHTPVARPPATDRQSAWAGDLMLEMQQLAAPPLPQPLKSPQLCIGAYREVSHSLHGAAGKPQDEFGTEPAVADVLSDNECFEGSKEVPLPQCRRVSFQLRASSTTMTLQSDSQGRENASCGTNSSSLNPVVSAGNGTSHAPQNIAGFALRDANKP